MTLLCYIFLVFAAVGFLCYGTWWLVTEKIDRTLAEPEEPRHLRLIEDYPYDWEERT